MTSKLKADLEDAISDWLCEITEDGTNGDYGVHPQLVEQMAIAAAAVYDATFDAQRFYEHEQKDQSS